jgi:hypothetical protein
MNKELIDTIETLLTEVHFLRIDWADLGWDSEGCPDGDSCDDFENKLAQIDDISDKVRNLLKKIK